jgi:CHAD domain-containing protein
VTNARPSFPLGADILEGAATVVRAGEDPEGVHRLRVTCRRLRVGLELAALRPLRDDLDWLTGGLGFLRDLDVLLATKGIPKDLRGWASHKRKEIRPQALALLDDTRFRSLIRAIRSLPELVPRDAEDRLGGFERRVLKAARRQEKVELPPCGSRQPAPDLAVLRDLPALTRTHALRKAIRKLRYAREWANLDVGSLRSAQEGFGVLSDDALLLRSALAWHAEGGTVPQRLSSTLGKRILTDLASILSRWQDVEATLTREYVDH